MAEKEESGSKLDALLERIPALDGGGRRRLTAGTITLLAVLAAFSNVWPTIKELAAPKETPLSLLLAVGALLIYATGVLVELIGEIFLARAVANAVWSYVEAANYSQRWRRLLRPIGWMYITLWGSIRALSYFSQGLFGRSRWRMRFRRRLSANAGRAYDQIPYPVRLALKHSLGAKAEFGRMALIELLTSPRKRKWAKTLMERPKDVLALVSALVVSLLILLVWSPIRQDLTPTTRGNLEAMRSDLDGDIKHLTAAWGDRYSLFRAINAKPDVPSLKNLRGVLESFDNLRRSIRTLRNLTYEESLKHSNEFAIAVAYDVIYSACNLNEDAPNAAEPLATISQKVETAESDACEAFEESTARLPRPIFAAYEELSASAEEQAIVRIVSGVAALFLYVAFFNTLTSVTISVIEAIGLEESPNVGAEPAATAADLD